MHTYKWTMLVLFIALMSGCDDDGGDNGMTMDDAQSQLNSDATVDQNVEGADGSQLDGGMAFVDVGESSQDMSAIGDTETSRPDMMSPAADAAQPIADADTKVNDSGMGAGTEDGPGGEENVPGGGDDSNMMDFDLSACTNGMCAMPPDDRVGDMPPEGGGWASNMREQCTVVAKVNADLHSGRTLTGNRSPDDAVTALEACLQAEGCYNPRTGFGPPVRTEEAGWRRCFDALCSCNNQIIEGPDIMCELTYIFGNRRASPRNCDAPGSIAIFKIPPSPMYPNGGSHAVTVTDYSFDDGDHLLSVRDPNCPDHEGDIQLDMNGRVVDTLAAEIPAGATLSGCFTFE